MDKEIKNTPTCDTCQPCYPNVKIDKIEEGMTGKEVADLLYNNFDKLNKSKANKCVERKVRHLLRGENGIYNETAKNKFIQQVFYTWSKKDYNSTIDYILNNAPSIEVGTTTTLPAGSQATVTATKDGRDAVLNFGIPKGDKGDKGDQGIKGDSGVQLGDIVLSQELGNDEDTVISQKTVTNEINNIKANTGIDEYSAFSESIVYSVGDVVNYNGRLYKFISNHAAGAWNGSDVEDYNIKSSLEEKNAKLTNVVNGISYYTQRLYDLSNIKAEFKDYTLVYAITDGQGNIAWGITSDGKIVETLPQSTSDAINSLKQEFISNFQPRDKTRDDLFGVVDEKGYPAFLIDKGGNINISNLINGGRELYVSDGQGNVAILVDLQGKLHTNYLNSHNKDFCVVDEKGNIGLRLDAHGKLHTNLYESAKEAVYPDYQLPECMFTVLNDCYADDFSIGRSYVPTLKIERITEDNVLIGNGGRCLPLVQSFNDNLPTSVVSTLRISNKLRGKDYDDVDFSFSLYTTKNSVLVDKNIRLMCLGDSLTDMDDWTSYIGKLINMDNIDYKKKMSIIEDRVTYKSIGIRANDSTHFTKFSYRDVNVNFTDYNEGRSSWAAATYLRHATLMTWATVTYNGQLKGVGGHVAWHILGLFEKEGNEYTGTVTQKHKIQHTCNGQYPITIRCIDGWVWNNFRSRVGLSSVEFDNASAEQKTTLLHWLDGTGENNILDNPDNPFFSRNKVEETKDTDNCYAFDWQTYYDRYKTHADNGAELDDKGTKYISNSYVCTPNFIAMHMGANDGAFGRTTDEDIKYIVDDVYKIASLLREQTGAKVMIFDSAAQLCNFPELSMEQGLAIGEKYVASADANRMEPKRNRMLMELLGDFNKQKSTGIFYCPAYFMERMGAQYDRPFNDIGSEEVKGWIVTRGNVHPSYLGYADIGYEVYSMLCYLLTL